MLEGIVISICAFGIFCKDVASNIIDMSLPNSRFPAVLKFSENIDSGGVIFISSVIISLFTLVSSFVYNEFAVVKLVVKNMLIISIHIIFVLFIFRFTNLSIFIIKIIYKLCSTIYQI